MKTREAVLTALETQAVISKPRPNPRIRRFLTTVHILTLNELHGGDSMGIAVVRAGMVRLAESLRAAIARTCPRCGDAAQRCIEVMAAIAGLRTLQRAGFDERMLRVAARKFAFALASG